MDKQIKVLVVEDNKQDFQIIKEYLKEYKKTFSIVASMTLADAIDKIKTNMFDVVLLDLGLPDSNGSITYNKLKEQTLGLLPPTVVLTGFDDEDLAIKMVGEMGAQDYVLKDDISKSSLRRIILYAIERHKILGELQQYKNNLESLVLTRTDQLNESYARYRTLADASPVGLFRTDENGQCVYVNKAWLERNNIEYYTENEFIYWTGSISEGFQNQYNKLWNECCEKKTNFEIEIKLTKKDKSSMWALIKAKPVNETSVSGYVGTIIDITSRKELLPEIIEFRKTLKSSKN